MSVSYHSISHGGRVGRAQLKHHEGERGGSDTRSLCLPTTMTVAGASGMGATASGAT